MAGSDSIDAALLAFLRADTATDHIVMAARLRTQIDAFLWAMAAAELDAEDNLADDGGAE